MARKKQFSKSSERSQAQKEKDKQLRADWRKLERLGVVKKRAKGQELNLTSYKRKRLKQLAPIISGEAQAVSLGPKALRAARANGTQLAGRYAIVPQGKKIKEAIRRGEPVSSKYKPEIKIPKSELLSDAVANIVDISEGGKSAPIPKRIEARLRHHSKEALSVITTLPKNRSKAQAYWNEWVEDNDYEYDDERHNPLYYK